MAASLTRWDNTKIPNCENFFLSAQRSSALQRTLLCQASLTEDLLSDSFKFLLTTSDSIEWRFGQYRQTSGGRFLVGLKDVIWSGYIVISTQCCEDAIQQEDFDNIMEIGFENVMLSEETIEAAAHISGYIAKTLVKRLGHCYKNYCINESETASTTYVYIDLLSRGGLTLPSECLVTYVCYCFTFIDHAINIIKSSKMKERAAAESFLNIVMFYEPFLCSVHWSTGQSMTHRIIVNIYFNNKRKIMTDPVHKDNVVSFEKQHREK